MRDKTRRKRLEVVADTDGVEQAVVDVLAADILVKDLGIDAHRAEAIVDADGPGVAAADVAHVADVVDVGVEVALAVVEGGTQADDLLLGAGRCPSFTEPSSSYMTRAEKFGRNSYWAETPQISSPAELLPPPP